MKMPAGIEKWGSGVLGVVSLLLAAKVTKPAVVAVPFVHRTGLMGVWSVLSV